MGSYTIISQISKKIIDLLCENIIPEPIKKTEDIGLCSPDDRGSSILGIYLYNIEENAETKSMERVFIDKEHYKNPPVSLNLYYMFFVHSKSEIISRAIDEQRILGKVIQVFNDNPRIYIDNEVFDVQALYLEYNDKNKILSSFENKSDLVCFYKISPVFIESEKIKVVKRVLSAEISVNHK